MPYAVDGNNLLGALTGRGPAAGGGREELARRLAAGSRSSRARITIVFDGEGPAGRNRSSLGTIDVRYAGARSADDAIARLVEGADRPREWIVVTDDRGLARRVRDANARVMGTGEFWSAFGISTESEGSAPGGDAASWAAYFADERNRLR